MSGSVSELDGMLNSMCTFTHHPENRVHEVNDEKANVESFDDAVIREATAINSKVKGECVREAIELGGLSWGMIENQRKDFIVGKLRVIAELDETQCNTLFEKLDGAVPIAPEMERRNRVLQIRRMFHQKWIMKCMYSAFNCFQCFCA